MTNRTLALEDLKSRTLEEIFREVLKQREILTIRLPEGEAVAIAPAPLLKPLPVLEGFVPEGWKDAVNG